MVLVLNFYKYTVEIFGILEHKSLFDGISLCDTYVKNVEKKYIGYEKLEILYFNNIEAFEICIVYYLYEKFMNKYFD